MQDLRAGRDTCPVHGITLNGFETFTFCNACDTSATEPITSTSTDSKEFITDGLRISNTRVINAKQAIVGVSGSGNTVTTRSIPSQIDESSMLVIPNFTFHKQAGGKTQLNPGDTLLQFKAGVHLQGSVFALVNKISAHSVLTGKTNFNRLSFKVGKQVTVNVYETRGVSNSSIMIDGILYTVV